jgi:glycosyltransferase involved in cell wall biosynthesis
MSASPREVERRMPPKVSFIVPCYKLAHLLPDCVNSILGQTHSNLEVLIMDDCSPDDTPAVAASFTDPRVRHIRNDPNLGHLRNYNKGIGLATGEYIWLISADDRLRRPYVLEKYVAAMEQNPRVGYAFCPGFTLLGDQETQVIKYSVIGPKDEILDGRKFLESLLITNHVLSAAGMVRKSVYDSLGLFPLDLPFAGDWYLWSLFALHHDVAYFAEPMVNYREHAGAMTNILIDKDIRSLSSDDLAVRWRLRGHIEKAGQAELLRQCDAALARDYAYFLAPRSYRGVTAPPMSRAEFSASIAAHTPNAEVRRGIERQALTALADELYARHEYRAAAPHYLRAISLKATDARLWAKLGLLCLGDLGYALRRRFSTS